MPTPNLSYFQEPPAYGSGVNYDDFTLQSVQKFKRDRGILDEMKGAQAGVATGNPYIAAAGLGLDLLGKGVEFYGASQERKAAEAEAKAAEKRYQAELARRDLLDRQREDQQRRANEMAYGDYAMNYENQAQQLYGQYQ